MKTLMEERDKKGAIGIARSLLNPLKKEVRTHIVRLKDEAKRSVIAIRIGPSQIPIKRPN